MIKNPLSGRNITVGGKVYQKLVKDGVINSDTVITMQKTSAAPKKKPTKKRVVWPVYISPATPGFSTVIDHRGALVRYYPNFINNPKKSFRELQETLQYAKNEKRLFGDGPAKRKTLQVADHGVRLYRYSTASAESTMPWEKFPVLVRLRKRAQEETGVDYNFALVNIYEPGVNLGWHSDDEDDMIDGCIVFSISFGAERWFDLEELAPRGPGGVEVQKDDFVPLRKRIKLEAGSALTMEKACQKVFRHRVPPFKTDEMRINITIRQMKKQS